MDNSLYYLEESLQWAVASAADIAWSLLGGLLILIIGWLVAKWVGGLVLKATTRANLDIALGRFLSQIVRYAVLIGAAISALATMGFEVMTFVAVLGAAGFAVGLALQGTLGHFASGVMLLIFRPLSVDDYVEAGGASGTVQDIGLFQTTLITPDNYTIYIPNGKITSDSVTNYTRQGTRRADIDVGVAYGTKVEDVHAACMAALGRVDGFLEEPAPGFMFTEMADSSLNFKFRAWANVADFWPLLHALRVEIYNELNARGIDIPFPQVVVHKAEE